MNSINKIIGSVNVDIKKAVIVSLIITIFIYSYSVISVYATVIDDMGSLSNWNTQVDGSASVTLSTTIGYSGTATEMTYKLSGGNWVQMYKRFDNSNMSGGDSIRFYVKGTGDTNSIELKAYDSDGDIATVVVNNITNITNWTPITVPFSSFSLWKDSNGNPFGNGILNTDKIIRYGINIIKSAGGTGTVFIDELTLYQQNPPGTKLIDDCETRTNASPFRQFVSTITENSSGQAILSVEQSTPSPMGGNYYNIAYNMGTCNWVIGANEDITTGGNSFDASSYSYINFYFKADATPANIKTKIELWWNSGTDQKYINDYGVLNSEWKFYSIPLSDFSGIDKSNINVVKITFTGGTGTTGTVYVDNFWFSTTQNTLTSSGVVSMINNMEGPFSPMTYSTNSDADAVCSVSAYTSGISGNAMQVSYDFKSANWITIEHGTGFNVAQDKGFRFKIKGTGSNNSLEFKVSDMNDTTYIRRFSNTTDTDDEWRTISIPYSELSLFSLGTRGASTLDLKNMKTINFAVTKSLGTEGSFTVDELEIITDPAYKSNPRPNKIILNISIDHNPFSPNGDGFEDTANISYTLNSVATVKLEIYGTDGNVVKTFEAGEQIAGAYTINWDGRKKNGDIVRNGLYFYRLSAEDYSGAKDKIINLIGVIR